MRILHVPHAYHPAIGGAELVTKWLSEGLAARGHDVTVLVADLALADGFDDVSVGPSGAPAVEELAGVRVVRAPVHATPDSAVARAARFRAAVGELLGSQPFDIVLATPHLLPNVVAAIDESVAAGVPVAHMPLMHETDAAWPVATMLRAAASVTGLIAVTEHEERRLVDRYGAAPERVFRCGLAVPESPPGESASRLGGALYLGRIAPNKGLDLLAETAGHIGDVPITAAGTVSDEALAERLRTAGVEVLGAIDEDRKDQLLRTTACVVLPSSVESFGLAVLDAWWRETPVVAVRSPAVASVVGDDGVLVAPEPAALANAIERVATDSELAARLGERGRRRVQATHRLDDMVSCIESAYAAIGQLAPPPAPDTPIARTEIPDRPTRLLLDPAGTRWPDDDAFEDWVEQADSRGLPRYAQAAYWSRPDIRAGFPATSTRALDLVSWLEQVGVAPHAPPGPIKRLLRRVGRNDDVIAAPRSPLVSAPGVNVFGYLSAATGLGAIARDTVAALGDAAVPLAGIDVSDRIMAAQPFSVDVAPGAPHDTTIYHLNGPELLGYAQDSLACRHTAGWNIGFWAWETPVLPATWREATTFLDEIWVSSEFVRAAVAGLTDRPIHVMGHPVSPPIDLMAPEPSGRPFRVVFIADALSRLERKNPHLAIDAFREAFPSGDGVELVLKISHLAPDIELDLQRRAGGAPVRIIDAHLSEIEKWQLLAGSDAYLSLHASEGFGLPLLEAMAAGVPVVATGFGGNMDFMDDTNSLLVPYTETPATGGVYSGAGNWAAPDVGAAATLLRRLRDEPVLAVELGAAGRTTAERFSLEHYRQRLIERLAAVGAAG